MKNWKKIIQLCVFLLISFFITMGFKVHFGGSVESSIEKTYIDPFVVADLVVYIVVFGLLYGAFFLIRRFCGDIQKFLIMNKNYRMRPLFIWSIVWGVLVVAWLPYLLSFAPGSVLGDSLSSIQQIYSGEYSNHHPVLYTLLVGVFIRIGDLLGNVNIGVFLYTCFQYLLLSATLSAVVTFLAKQRVQKIVLIIVVCFFAICPIFPSYAIIMWKDPIFSIALLMFSLMLFDLAKNEFRNMRWWHYVILVVLAIAIAFFRNNGVFILLPSVLILFIVFRKLVAKTALTIFITTVFALLVQGPVYSALNIYKPSVEAFSIPLQQVAWVITQNENSFSEEEKEFLNQIMPLDTWRKAYTPALVDSIKWHEDFNTKYFESNLGNFLQLWAKKFPSEFNGYVNAYFLETMGFWHPYYQNSYGYIDQYIIENDVGIHNIDLIQKVFGISIKDSLEKFRPMISTGLMVIIMMFSMILSLEFQKRRVLMLYLTSVLCWAIIMISTPVAFSLRYVFVLILALPIFVLCPFFRDKKQKRKLLIKNDIIEE